MRKSLVITGLLMSATILSGRLRAGDVPKCIDIIIDDNPRWQIALVEGEIGFIGGWTPQRPGESNTKMPARIPADHISRGVYRNGDTLQAYVSTLVTWVDPNELRNVPKVQAEKHDWYLTGDYSGKQPTLKLTKKSEKYSHWEFISAGKTTGAEDHEPVTPFFIRNVNDLGKEAWLVMEDVPGVRYLNEGEFRKATLSFQGGQRFEVPGGATGK